MLKNILISFMLLCVPLVGAANATQHKLTIAEFLTNGLYPISGIHFLIWFEN